MAKVTWAVAAGGSWSHGLVAGLVAQGAERLCPSLEALDQTLQGALSSALRDAHFLAKADTSLGLWAPGLRRAFAVGLGKAPFTLDAFRMAGGRAVLAARDLGGPELSLLVPAVGDFSWKGAKPSQAQLAEALALGAALASFRFDRYRKAPEADEAAKQLAHVELVAGPGVAEADLKQGLARATAIAEAAELARAWVATPGRDLTPVSWAKEVAELPVNVSASILAPKV